MPAMYKTVNKQTKEPCPCRVHLLAVLINPLGTILNYLPFSKIFSCVSKANIDPNIQTDGEARKGRILLTLLEQFHLDLFENTHLKNTCKNINPPGLGSLDLRYKRDLNHLSFISVFVLSLFSG